MKTFTKTLTATNQKVQFFLTYSNKRASKHQKIKRMQQIEQDLEQSNVFMDELFKRKSIRVLDEIVYLTTMAGVIKIGADKLALNSGVSERTVYSAVATIKEYQQIGLVVGYLKNSRKYVFVDLQHEDAPTLLASIFGLSQAQIAERFAVWENAKKPAISSVESDFLSPNNITNKTLINKKTSTKDSESSNRTKKATSFYSKIKKLFEARRDSLHNFRVIVGVLYAKMRKIKADSSLTLSHAQLEGILYASLDALLNMQHVKNELAMLNGIINNKINDATKAVVSKVQATTQRVEWIPAWFETRNEQEEKNVDPHIDFEQERMKILAKLGYATT